MTKKDTRLYNDYKRYKIIQCLQKIQDYTVTTTDTRLYNDYKRYKIIQWLQKVQDYTMITKDTQQRPFTGHTRVKATL